MKIKVLIVCSGNTIEGETFDFRLHHSFVYEQTEALKKHNIEFDYFFLKGKGIKGYSKNYQSYIRLIKAFNPDIVHAHYGLSGLFANLQRKIPVITTFHGSDVFLFKFNRVLSRVTHFLSEGSIVVSRDMAVLLGRTSKTHYIPCGVDIYQFFPLANKGLRFLPCIEGEKRNILFSSRFDYYEKNYPLAKEVMKLLGPGYNLIELKGYTREEINLLINTCDVALMTSISEGSPMFIKEVMACSCPVVSTDVGDVRDLFADTEGCYITSFDPVEIAGKVKQGIEFRMVHKHTKGRERIIESGLDSESIARKIIEAYKFIKQNVWNLRDSTL